MWQQRQGRPAQQRNARLSSKSPNILVWRITVSSIQLQWSRLVHSMRQLVSFWKISGEGSPWVGWRETERLPVPKVICCNSAIQRYLAPQQFRGGRPPGLMVILAFTFSNYFLLALGIGDALGTKIIITRKFATADRSIVSICGRLCKHFPHIYM